ncbi:radical SAM protein [Clostridium sp. BNL1100]|uniref:radical SAM protein n=1 Tax=Clostridium sp. BNL1100 TaxID=755731 RepID=UPI00024A740C|nr:radical SAM protein [Clostridium sp. BNL1100]AEY67261.1 radical SAM superfamily enzyme [Clostridium sp. BNL1100]
MKRNKNLIFNICNQCNVKCRHCSNAETLNDGKKAEPPYVLKWLEDASEADFSEATFVGGEPFLYVDDLILYCKKTHELGMKSCIITNGFWATNLERAVELLKSIKGLDSILVSSDIFHLEYIDSQTIKNVFDACIQLNINIAMNATCSSKEDKKKIWDIYSEYKNSVFINTHMLMPIGAAKSLPVERWCLEDKIAKLPVVCGIDNFLVDMDGDVHACCNSILSKEPLFYVGNMKKESLSLLLKNFIRNPLYCLMKEQGPRGLGKFLMNSPYYQEFSQKEYTCECDFCISVLESDKLQKYIISQILNT